MCGHIPNFDLSDVFLLPIELIGFRNLAYDLKKKKDDYFHELQVKNDQKNFTQKVKDAFLLMAQKEYSASYYIIDQCKIIHNKSNGYAKKPLHLRVFIGNLL